MDLKLPVSKAAFPSGDVISQDTHSVLEKRVSNVASSTFTHAAVSVLQRFHCHDNESGDF